jgi:hypothetical protein
LNKYVIVFFCLLFSACSSVKPSQPTLAQQPSQTYTKDYSDFISGLSNAEYQLDAASTGKIKLIDGAYDEPLAPDSASKLQVNLGKEQALGDINGDGQIDAIISLYVDPGGSGIFVYFSLVINQNGKPSPLPSYLLGDRIKIKSLSIAPNKVIVLFLDRKNSEPMSTAPSVEIVRQYLFQSNKLTEVK